MYAYVFEAVLDRRHGAARRDAQDPYQLHRTLARAFCTAGDDEENARRLEVARPLYRIDPCPKGWAVRGLARVAPEFSRIVRPGPGYWALEPSVLLMDLIFRSGESCAFALRARPSAADSGRRRALRGPDASLEWLARKAAAGGFEILDARYRPVSWDDSRGEGFRRVGGAEFRGELRVVDPDCFGQTLRSGVGPGKAVGFGLLWLENWSGQVRLGSAPVGVGMREGLSNVSQ